MTHQEKRSNYDRIRRTRLQAARNKGTHTKGDWESLQCEFGHSCVRCGCIPPAVQKDHITPLYQGGSNSIDNIQPLCARCNSSKGSEDRNWVQYRREFGFNLGVHRG